MRKNGGKGMELRRVLHAESERREVKPLGPEKREIPPLLCRTADGEECIGNGCKKMTMMWGGENGIENGFSRKQLFKGRYSDTKPRRT